MLLEYFLVQPVLILFFIINKSYAELYKPTTSIRCDRDSHCPVEWPCCSPYGECGSGPICIGACNPRYSFNNESCIPLPIIAYPFNVVFHHNLHSNRFEIASHERYGMENNLIDHSDIVPLDIRMNRKGFVHHSNFLITDSDIVANRMLNKFDFVYSGHTNIDRPTGDILLAMPKKTTGSLIASTREFLYGRASVTLKTARSQGVITAIVLISQVGDEIDFEFLGNRLHEAQTNFYYQTELDYTRMIKGHITSNSFENYHTYEFDWNEERIIWLIDGVPMRTLHKKDTWDPQRRIFRYPQTPVRLEVAIWPGGNNDNHPGTIEWAGGQIDWENAADIIEKKQFYAKVREIHIDPKQNQHFGDIFRCITKKDDKSYIDITDLTKITTSFDHNIWPEFSEGALKWHCSYIPRLGTAHDSGMSRKKTHYEDYLKKTHLKMPKQSNITTVLINSTMSNLPNITLLEDIILSQQIGDEYIASFITSGASSLLQKNIIKRLARQFQTTIYNIVSR